MKDAKGHGSNPRGSHAAGVDKVGVPQKFVGYHGTAQTFDEFKPNTPFIKATGNHDINGVYFSGDPQSAANYAGMDQRRTGGGRQQVIAAEITMHNPLDITKSIAKFRKQGMSFGDAKRAALKAVGPGHDGVVFKGNSVNPPEYIAFHPSQIARIKR
jgi:hypothetical protein